MTRPSGFSWFECYTDGLDDAADFYTHIVPWGTEQWKGGDEPYTVFKVGSKSVAGLVELPPEHGPTDSSPHWLGYVTVDNIDETLSRLKELGGTPVTEIVEIGEHGHMSIVRDPQGARFALHQMDAPPEEEGGESPEQHRPGAISW
jgi:predicted enzyme related to lactoylglutathione lyase